MESSSSDEEDQFYSASSGSDGDHVHRTSKDSDRIKRSNGSDRTPTDLHHEDHEPGGDGQNDDLQFVVKNLDTGETTVVKVETIEKVQVGDVECIVKNLDTGESFSSTEIEKYVPKGIDPSTLDPIAYNIMKRSPGPEKRVVTNNGKKKMKLMNKKKWMTKFSDTKKKLSSSESKSKKKNLFAQVSRQVIKDHKGAVWVMKFCYDGTYMASAGNDALIRVWKAEEDPTSGMYFKSQPFRVYKGHEGDILDMSWSNSRSNLLLTASMDHTVRLWSVNDSNECKYTFRHRDVVTSVVIHPTNEELCITGCLDNRLRIWNMVEKSILFSAHVACGFITTAAFTLDGNIAITGSYDGKITFFLTKDLQCINQKSVHAAMKKGKKVTGIQMMPDSSYILVTSNDSKVRMFNLKDYSRVCGYKGLKNENFQLFASFSEKGGYIVCGSEDQNIYLWPNDLKKGTVGFKTARVHDSFQAHSNIVTAAIFAPVLRRKTTEPLEETSILVSADISGEIKVFENKTLTDGRPTSKTVEDTV